MKELFKLIEELKSIRKIPQFLYYHGIDWKGSISVRQCITEFQKNNSNIKEIDLILNSPGGTADDAYRIIRHFRAHFDIVNVVIPFWAKSAATLMAFGGTKIIMDEFGEFGPLDTQLAKEKEDSPDYDRESALIDELSLKRIEERAQQMFKTMFIYNYNDPYIPINKNHLLQQLLTYVSNFYVPLLSQINPYKIGDKKRKLDIAAKYSKRILDYVTMEESKKKSLIDFLINGCPDHSYNIDYKMISEYLPNVVLSETIGKEYCNKLAEISIYFYMVNEEESHIGFIGENMPEPKIAINGTKNDSLINTEKIRKPKSIKTNGKAKIYNPRE